MEMTDFLVLGMFVTFIALLLTGYPVAFCLAGTSILFTFVGSFADAHLGTAMGLDFNFFGMLTSRIYAIMTNWVLISLPMFIYMGLMLDRSGVAERLMMSTQKLFGSLRGGLAVTVTLIGVLLAASTGIVGASVVLLGLLSLPAMFHQGYSKTLALGTVAGAGTLGILIPPSIMLVVMGDQLGLSVGDLFMGAVVPGLLLAFLYIIFILIYATVKPDAAPLMKDKQPISLGVFLEVLKHAVPPSLLILAVLGTIFAGIATVTEASGVGALMATILAASYKKLNLKVFKEVLVGTFNTTAYIFGILIGATAFALVMRGLGGDELIQRSLTSLPFSAYGIVIFILACIFILGFFLDWVEICLIVLPLIGPAISTLDLPVPNYGVLENAKLLWFLILVAVTLQTSFLTPPVGFSLFYLKGVAPPHVTLSDIYKGIIPFVLLQLSAVVLVALWPSLATWLPAVIYGR